MHASLILRASRSDVTHWDMGFLTSSDWAGAQWIGAASTFSPNDTCSFYKTHPTPLLRSSFAVPASNLVSIFPRIFPADGD
jgi:hypothetical protein